MTCPVHTDRDAERTEETAMASPPHKPEKEARDEELETVRAELERAREKLEMAREVFERVREGLMEAIERSEWVREKIEELIERHERAQEVVLNMVREEGREEEWRNTVAIPVLHVLVFVALGMMCYGDDVSRDQTLVMVLGEFQRPMGVVGEISRGLVYGGRALAAYVFVRCILILFGMARPWRGDNELSMLVGMILHALVLILVGRYL